jgi:aminotransferase
MRVRAEMRMIPSMNSIRLSSRMRDLAQSDIRRMTLECARVGGINLGQGICDLPTIPELKDGLAAAVEADRSTYSRYDGVAELREAIAARLATKNGVTYDPDGEIVVTVGSTGAFAMAVTALLDPGDEVLLPEPFYGYHWNTVLAAGGVPRPVPLAEPDFAVDLDALERAVTDRTRAVVVCSPANPTGKVWSAEELDGLAAILHRHDLRALTDEIYEDILYDGRAHLSLAARPGGRERTITISGFSKTFSITGWRIGFAAAPRELAAALGVLNDLYYVCAPTPLQHAVAHALNAVPPSYYENLARDYQRKRDLLAGTCERLGWRPRVPAGAYYLMAEPRSVGARTAREASDAILRDAGVATIPGSAFYRDGGGEHLIRFCFAKTDEDLGEACRRLEAIYAGTRA